MQKILLPVSILFPLLVFSQADKIESLKAAVKNGECEKAMPIIQSLITKGQALHLAWYSKAACEFRDKQYDSSVIYSTLALNASKISDTLYYTALSLRAMSYGFAGQLDSAIIDQEKLVNAFPSDMGQLLNLSFLYGQNLQHAKSISVLHQALKIDSLDVYIINNLAYEYCETKEFELAIYYAGQGLKLTKDSVWIGSLLNSLGYALGMSRSMEKGIETINESLSYNPNNPYAYFNIGRLYLEKKDPANACVYFKKTKETGGENLSYHYLTTYCK